MITERGTGIDAELDKDAYRRDDYIVSRERVWLVPEAHAWTSEDGQEETVVVNGADSGVDDLTGVMMDHVFVENTSEAIEQESVNPFRMRVLMMPVAAVLLGMLLAFSAATFGLVPEPVPQEETDEQGVGAEPEDGGAAALGLEPAQSGGGGEGPVGDGPGDVAAEAGEPVPTATPWTDRFTS